MKKDDPKSAARAEAAVWFSRLKSEDRSAAVEAGFRVWLQRSPEHQAAFDLANTAWDLIGEAAAMSEPRRTPIYGLAAAIAAIIVLGGAGFWMLCPPKPESFNTGFGEQRRIALADGSFVLLDSSTSMSVSMSRKRRDVELVKGRAHFEVAKDETRPFAVHMADRQVVAVGTAFDVDRTREVTTVLLTAGKVLVESSSDRRMLSPGDRLTFDHGRIIADRPELDPLVGWQTGRAVFRRRALRDVIEELNRYSHKRLEIAEPSMGDVLISGVYRTGDNAAFAAAVSAMMPVDVEAHEDRILLKPRHPLTASSGS